MLRPVPYSYLYDTIDAYDFQSLAAQVVYKNNGGTLVMPSRFTLIIIGLVVGFGGIFWFTKQRASTPTTTNNAQLSEHKSGTGTAKVTLTEYGDFACPACYQFYPVVEQVREKYKDQITFQFLHYPLTEIHQNALVASRAAEAAGVQGKFWEMYKQLYETQPNWRDSGNPLPLFEQFAEGMGLDKAKFVTDLKSDQINAIVQADRNNAKGRGFTSTPTFLINDKQIENPRDAESFYKVIDDAIKNAKK
jgi:protein-disulfide isomerase